MKILIDDQPIEGPLPEARSFPEFCEKIMAILLSRNLSIGSCEFDGQVVANVEEANDLFHRCEVCRIASIPLATAMESALTDQCREVNKLVDDGEEMVTLALLAEPEEIALRWHMICEGIKKQIGLLPRLSGLLTEAQVNHLADRQLDGLGGIMRGLHTAFEKGDTVEISDAIELGLLPWLQDLQKFLESCRLIAKNLHH